MCKCVQVDAHSEVADENTVAVVDKTEAAKQTCDHEVENNS